MASPGRCGSGPPSARAQCTCWICRCGTDFTPTKRMVSRMDASHDRICVVDVVLVGLDVRDNELRAHQRRLVSQSHGQARPMVRTAARLHDPAPRLRLPRPAANVDMCFPERAAGGSGPAKHERAGSPPDRSVAGWCGTTRPARQGANLPLGVEAARHASFSLHCHRQYPAGRNIPSILCSARRLADYGSGRAPDGRASPSTQGPRR